MLEMVTPLPRPETTPPVTTMYFILIERSRYVWLIELFGGGDSQLLLFNGCEPSPSPWPSSSVTVMNG